MVAGYQAAIGGVVNLIQQVTYVDLQRSLGRQVVTCEGVEYRESGRGKVGIFPIRSRIKVTVVFNTVINQVLVENLRLSKYISSDRQA